MTKRVLKEVRERDDNSLDGSGATRQAVNQLLQVVNQRRGKVTRVFENGQSAEHDSTLNFARYEYIFFFYQNLSIKLH